MTTTPARDLLIELQFRLPNHTYRAVKGHAEGLDDQARTSYLTSILAEIERSEGKGREE